MAESGTLRSYFDEALSSLFLDLRIVESDDKHVGYAVHPCNDDRYQATFTFERSSFTTEYIVEGPRKNFVLTTTYSAFPRRFMGDR